MLEKYNIKMFILFFGLGISCDMYIIILEIIKLKLIKIIILIIVANWFLWNLLLNNVYYYF